jgi:hypothetical protein
MRRGHAPQSRHGPAPGPFGYAKRTSCSRSAVSRRAFRSNSSARRRSSSATNGSALSSALRRQCSAWLRRYCWAVISLYLLGGPCVFRPRQRPARALVPSENTQHLSRKCRTRRAGHNSAQGGSHFRGIASESCKLPHFRPGEGGGCTLCRGRLPGRHEAARGHACCWRISAAPTKTPWGATQNVRCSRSRCAT